MVTRSRPFLRELRVGSYLIYPSGAQTKAQIDAKSLILGIKRDAVRAEDLNRALFFMLSVMDRPDLKWPTEMVQYGAQALDDDLDDVAPLLDNLPYGDPLAALSA